MKNEEILNISVLFLIEQKAHHTLLEFVRELVADDSELKNVWDVISLLEDQRNANYDIRFLYKVCKLTGTCKLWHLKGYLEEECEYKNGLMDGIRKLFFENGKVAEIYSYKEGILHGSYQRWDERGNLREKCFYVNNQLCGHAQSWYPDNISRIERYYKRGLLHGPQMWLNDKGTVIDYNNYKEGQIVTETLENR